MLDMSANNKVAIITGGARGIGWSTAEHFIDNGIFAVIADIGKCPKAFDKYINAGNGLFVMADVSKEDNIKKLIDLAYKKFGRIDFVINNAAIAFNKPIEKLSLAQWNKVVSVNLTAAFLTARYSAKYLRKTKGAIVNIASTRALMSEKNTETYSATKGGLLALTHSLAISLSPDIRVNCISPGWIDTRRSPDDSKTPPPFSKADHLQQPCGRIGTPRDIAEMVLYLCSDKAGFITGQNFVIDGGITKKMIYI